MMTEECFKQQQQQARTENFKLINVKNIVCLRLLDDDDDDDDAIDTYTWALLFVISRRGKFTFDMKKEPSVNV